MTRPKFTVGPWKATKTKGGKGKVETHDGFSVATLMAGTFRQQEYDAALIAAAPKMFAKLVQISSDLHAGGSNLVDDIDALIAEALGETP
jgi:hypothetical protein